MAAAIASTRRRAELGVAGPTRSAAVGVGPAEPAATRATHDGRVDGHRDGGVGGRRRGDGAQPCARGCVGVGPCTIA